MMYLNELLSIPTLQELTLINQNACLDRPVATIESTETPDVISYVPKNCFIITTAMAYKENQEKLCELILSLDKLPCAGLGIKLGRFIDELDPKVIQTADSVGFPLINIPIHLTLGEVYHRFLSLLWNVENDNLVDALNTQKQLYNLIIQGVPLRQVLKLISAKLNEPCLIVDRFGELCESVNTTEGEVKAAIAHIDGLNKDDNETICCSVRLPNYVKEVKLYIYPIKSIRRNSHFMVAFSREATSPLSFFVMEEVLLNLGMLFYKQLFTDLALTITYSLLASLLVALTLVPAMASGMLRRDFTPKAGLLDKLYPAYRKAISWSLDHKAFVLLLSLVLLVTSAWGALSRGFTFMPEIDMNNLSLEITMPEGTTREEAVEAADQVMERAMSVENVEAVGFMMGSGNMGGLSMTSSNNGDYDVTGYLTMTEGTFGSDAGREIEALCADLPCTVKASGVMSGMMSYMTGSGISLQVYGDDMEGLQTAARALGQRIGQVEGVKDVSDGLEDAAPALQVVVDRNAAMTRGVTVAQIYMQVAAALQDTTTVADVTLDGESMELMVDAAADSKLTREKLLDLTITPDSSMSAAMSGSSDTSGLSQLTGEETEEDDDGSFKLGEVAEVRETVSLNSIQRDQQRRCITVTATLADGYNVTKVTSAVQQAVAPLALPEGVTVEFNGENEQIMNAMGQLMLMLLLGVVLVYLIMVAQFQSLKSPFIVMFTIPLAFTGGFLALLVSGIEVSVVSLIGFVMLVGVIVNNGIVLVDYINQQRQDGMARREAIIDAGVTRLRPILMTSLTTILGLVVTALAKNAGTALIQPIALVCIGGLLYATLMTLFVVPCMYDMMNKKELRKVDDSELELLDI